MFRQDRYYTSQYLLLCGWLHLTQFPMTCLSYYRQIHQPVMQMKAIFANSQAIYQPLEYEMLQ